MPLHSRRSRLPFLALLLAPVAPALAQTYELTFTGTFDFMNSGLFGDSPAVPFDFRVQIDPTLDANSVYVPATGPGYDDFYGFSSGAIVGTSLSLGTATWTVADLQYQIVQVGKGADFYLNSDFEGATPSRIWMVFENSQGRLQLGGASSNGFGLNFQTFATFETYEPNYVYAQSNSAVIPQVAAIPEPASFVLLAGVMALGVGLGRRRVSRPPGVTPAE